MPLHVPDAQRGCSCPKGRACPTPGKHPRIKDWQQRATSDLAQIDAWLGAWPDSNVGLLCGGGLGVQDVDNRSGGFDALAVMVKQHGPLPATASVSTGDGGHFYFSVPAGARSHDLAPGLEFHAEGRLVVAPPSLHPSGAVYAWVRSPDDVALAPAPAWVLQAASGRRNGAAADGGPIHDGARNKTLASLAGTMRARDMTEAEILAALLAVNRDRCNPPLEEGEVQAIAESYAKRPRLSEAAKKSAEKFTVIEGDDLHGQLTAALRLDSLTVTGAEMHGRGPSALVAIHLSDGTTIDAERFSDLLNTSRLGALVIAATGTPVLFKAMECATVAALTKRLAKRVAVVTANDLAREWGAAFLHAASVIDLNMADQRERWGAFARLDDTDPIAEARQSSRSIAAVSVVLRDNRTGARYVHSNWFLAHVRRDVGPINAGELVNRMSYAGWQRRGARGRIKATNGADGQSIPLPLYIVPKGWEDE